MVAVSEAKAPYSSSIGKNQCVDQSSEALYMFQYGVWYFPSSKVQALVARLNHRNATHQ